MPNAKQIDNSRIQFAWTAEISDFEPNLGNTQMTMQLNPENIEEALNSDLPVLIDFFTPTWPPCKRLGPVVDELAEKNEGNAIVAKVDVAEHMELAVKYGVTGVPTIIVFKGGEVATRETGCRALEDLQSMIDSNA